MKGGGSSCVWDEEASLNSKFLVPGEFFSMYLLWREGDVFPVTESCSSMQHLSVF